MFEINAIEIVGLIAAVLTTSAFLPQVIKTWKVKNVENLSLTMYIVMFLGVMMWLVYGILQSSISIVLANIVTGVLTFTLILLKIKYRGKN